MTSPIVRRAVASVAALAVAVSGAALVEAAEDVLRAAPAARTPARLELEAHAAVGTAPPGFGQGSGVGGGLRAAVTVLPAGFLPNVDDSVAIGVGVDDARYYGKWALNGYGDHCLRYDTAPGGTRVCSDVTSKGGTYDYLYVPVVIQWNVRLRRSVSLFAEPGVSLYHLDEHGWGVVPAGFLGVRLRLTDRAALTVRVGYPAAALGLSFLL